MFSVVMTNAIWVILVDEFHSFKIELTEKELLLCLTALVKIFSLLTFTGESSFSQLWYCIIRMTHINLIFVLKVFHFCSGDVLF